MRLLKWSVFCLVVMALGATMLTARAQTRARPLNASPCSFYFSATDAFQEVFPKGSSGLIITDMVFMVEGATDGEEYLILKEEEETVLVVGCARGSLHLRRGIVTSGRGPLLARLANGKKCHVTVTGYLE
jgi:hypothetical protein